MNWNRRSSLSLALAATLCTTAANSLAQSPPPEGIVAQRITAPKASPKVATVLWTRRIDHYTLQVVFPRVNAITPSKQPDIALWLLGAEGAVIPASRDKVVLKGASEVSYSVPLAAGQSAVAVALKVDDEYFIEKLRPLD
jgi:hypothetical protein